VKNVPYHDNPGNACALACYTMVAQYILPGLGITFEQLGKIGNWRHGYVIWEFPVWNWLLDHGVYITDYEPADDETWAKDGIEGLKKSIPAEEFAWYRQNTYDLGEVTEHLQKTLRHPHFTYLHRRPTWDDVVAEHGKPGICDVVLNSQTLNRKDGVAAHRIVLLDITDTEVVFHDPNFGGSGIHRRETIDHFIQAFESLESRALARYSLSP
jgi:hypothetical protein